METTKIKLKIGQFEFDAEGPTETVQAQFQSFKELISLIPRESLPPVNEEVQQKQHHQELTTVSPHVPLEKILHASGRVISLTALPASVEDAALLILLGHKDLRNHIAVTGQEIGDGLTQSGKPIPRVDRIMEKAIGNAFVIKTGLKRGTRYRLSNQGLSKALAIARELLATVP